MRRHAISTNWVTEVYVVGSRLITDWISRQSEAGQIISTRFLGMDFLRCLMAIRLFVSFMFVLSQFARTCHRVSALVPPVGGMALLLLLQYNSAVVRLCGRVPTVEMLAGKVLDVGNLIELGDIYWLASMEIDMRLAR